MTSGLEQMCMPGCKHSKLSLVENHSHALANMLGSQRNMVQQKEVCLVMEMEFFQQMQPSHLILQEQTSKKAQGAKHNLPLFEATVEGQLIRALQMLALAPA